MGSKKVKLDSDLMDRARKIWETAGYSSVEEWMKRIGVSYRLHSWMNSVDFFASSLKMTPC